MATKTATPKGKKKQPAKAKKRKYNNDPLKKIAKGEPWPLHFDVHPDVAEHFVKEKQDTTKDYERIINEALADRYQVKI